MFSNLSPGWGCLPFADGRPIKILCMERKPYDMLLVTHFQAGGIYCVEVMIMEPCRFPKAVACITGGAENPCLMGRVFFHQKCGGVLVMAEVSGLPRDGFFAFHIHEGTSCSGPGFECTGGHYDPADAPHPNHAGDLPPLLSHNGRAKMTVLTGRFRVDEIIGKTVVIHSAPDDFTTQPAGNSGNKIACGIICRT